MIRRRVLGAGCAAALALAGAAAGTAQALPGPELREPAAALDAAVRCAHDPGASERAPVLLVHGTFVDASVWAPTYLRALPGAGHVACTVTIPDGELGDVQRSVEYVVHAIRTVRRRAGRPIAVLGHSQGAFLPTLALRYWPDLADDVADVVGLAGVYGNGTDVATAVCRLACAASARQLDGRSRLLAAYRGRALVAGPAYTTIATDLDELVTPQPRAGQLDGVPRLSVQSLCPGRPVEHGALLGDAVAYALALDALDHDGPADPGRVDRSVCGRLLLPGADAAGFALQLAKILPAFPGLVTRPVPREPALRCELDAACPRWRLRPTVRSATAPARVRRRPWRFVTTGAVVQPVGAIDRCAGDVVVRIARGRRTVSRRRVAVAPDCAFASTVILGRTRAAARRAGGRLRVSVRYAGAGELLPASAPARRLRAG